MCPTIIIVFSNYTDANQNQNIIGADLQSG